MAKHFVRIVVAYFLAASTAALLYGVFVLRYEYLDVFYDKYFQISWLIETIRSTAYFASLLTLAFALPSLPVILVCEFFRVSRPLVYVALTGLAGLSLAFALAIRDHSLEPNYAAMIPACNLAGLIYGVIAGRHAGSWREHRSAEGIKLAQDQGA